MGRSVATDLFREFADAHVHGAAPEARRYIERAGSDGELLATMIDRFLAAIPRRPAAGADVELLDEWLTGPPLLHARVRRHLTREEVVGTLIEELELNPGKREKVHDYYHRLETGQLDSSRVSARVYGTLGRLFKSSVRELVRWQPEPLAPAPAFFRAADVGIFDLPEPGATPASRDEIDELFTGN
jgi:hypothetical protein